MHANKYACCVTIVNTKWSEAFMGFVKKTRTSYICAGKLNKIRKALNFLLKKLLAQHYIKYSERKISNAAAIKIYVLHTLNDGVSYNGIKAK